MPGFLPDSNVMVAALSAWHEHHERAATEVERRQARGEPMVIAAPALVETYSALTRLPRPRRLAPNAALALIEDNFIRHGTIIALDDESYWNLLRRAAANGIAGGRIYDVVIATCGRMAQIDVLLTFNERDFLPFAGPGMAIVVPQAAS